MKQVEGQISLFDIFEPEKEKMDVNDVGMGAVFRYLRYGPHTLVPEVRKQCKEYLDSVNGELPEGFIKIYGNPKKWHPLPCSNCEYGRSGTCRAGGHTCHYEYGILICDAFKQTIVGDIPDMPCDTCGYISQGCCDYPCTPDDYCVLGDKWIPAKAICQYSKHTCNKENLWEVAEMDGGSCSRVCCRKCEVKGCGARCNGSSEPKSYDEAFLKRHISDMSEFEAERLRGLSREAFISKRSRIGILDIGDLTTGQRIIVADNLEHRPELPHATWDDYIAMFKEVWGKEQA